MTSPIQLPIPPAEMRWGGPKYRDDALYRSSALEEVQRLAGRHGMRPSSSVMDIGCGPGRLLGGLAAHFGGGNRYVGLDVHRPSIHWCQENLVPAYPKCEFHHIDFFNERYNPGGKKRTLNDLKIEGRFDYVFLFSVFSHMRAADVRHYLQFIRKHLHPIGRVILTAFVALGVEDEAENPPNYHREWKGPLHAVRFERFFFERMLFDAGLLVKEFHFRSTTDGQSNYVLMSDENAPYEATVFT